MLMIKNIIFDIGNVLMNFTWKPFIKSLFQDDETIKQVENAIWHTGLCNELDRNVIPEAEIFARMRSFNPEYEPQVVLALEQVKSCYHKTDYAIPWIKELKAAGYKVYFLSNYSAFSQRNNPECLDFLPYMDGGVFSCDVQHVKPDPFIYKEICRKYALQPAECIFMDDKLENVEAARNCGMQALQFTGYEETRAALKQLLE